MGLGPIRQSDTMVDVNEGDVIGSEAGQKAISERNDQEGLKTGVISKNFDRHTSGMSPRRGLKSLSWRSPPYGGDGRRVVVMGLDKASAIDKLDCRPTDAAFGVF